MTATAHTAARTQHEQQRQQQQNAWAVIYCRVSTKLQETDGSSLDSQERLCREKAAELGYQVGAVVREVYSGAELYDREKLAQVRKDIAAGRYAALISYTTDRLSRDPIHLALIAEECVRADCALVFHQDILDDSDEGRLLSYVKAYSSKKERERIRERSLRGKHQRVLSGKVSNMGPEKYGWVRDKAAGVRHIEEAQALVVRRIYALVADAHESGHHIARTFNAEGIVPPGGPGTRWNATTVLRIIRDPAYMGEATAWKYKQLPPPSRQQQDREKPAGTRRCVSKRLVARPAEEQVTLPPGVVPAIVAADVWQRAQAAVSAQQGDHTRNAKTAKTPYLLRGLVWCGRCGRKLYPSWQRRNSWNPASPKVPTYRCSSYSHPHSTTGGSCGAIPSNAAKLEAWVWAQVSAVLRDPDLIAAELHREQAEGPDPHLSADLATAQREAARCARKQADIMARYDPEDTAFPWEVVAREAARLEAERQRWQQQAEDIERRLADARRVVADLERLHRYCAQVSAKLEGADCAHQRLALEALDVRVTAQGQQWHLAGRIPLMPHDAQESQDAQEFGAAGDDGVRDVVAQTSRGRRRRWGG